MKEIDPKGETEEQRTIQQNKAMYLYFRLLAESLNDAGYSMSASLKLMDIDVPWTQENVKKIIWHEIEKAMIDKDSTADLNTKQVDQIYSVVDRFTSERFGVHVDFPRWDREPHNAHQ